MYTRLYFIRDAGNQGGSPGFVLCQYPTVFICVELRLLAAATYIYIYMQMLSNKLRLAPCVRLRCHPMTPRTSPISSRPTTVTRPTSSARTVSAFTAQLPALTGPCQCRAPCPTTRPRLARPRLASPSPLQYIAPATAFPFACGFLCWRTGRTRRSSCPIHTGSRTARPSRHGRRPDVQQC